MVRRRRHCRLALSMSCAPQSPLYEAASGATHSEKGKTRIVLPMNWTASHLNSLCSRSVCRLDVLNSKTEGDSLQCSQRRRSSWCWACMCASFQLQVDLNRGLKSGENMIGLTLSAHRCRLRVPSCSIACGRNTHVPRPACWRARRHPVLASCDMCRSVIAVKSPMH